MLEETSLQLCVFLAVIYGAETWTLTSQQRPSQQSHKDGIKYVEQWQKTDLCKRKCHRRDWKSQKMEWTWARHINRIWDNRWSSCFTTRSPYEGKLSRGSSARRWKGTIWQRIALDRLMWKQHAEAFTQPRDAMAAQWWWGGDDDGGGGGPGHRTFYKCTTFLSLSQWFFCILNTHINKYFIFEYMVYIWVLS